jgi:Cof subfamily protein (haloacid dehalogenase superfamily)
LIRLIAVDLDDTLLGQDLTISEANRAAIKEARERGIHVVLATARGWYSTRPFYETLSLDGFAVCGSGTKIYNSRGECVKTWNLPLERAKEILRIAERENIMVMCSVPDKNYFNFVREDWRSRMRPQVDLEVPGLADRLQEAPTQLFVKGKRETSRLLELLPRETPDYRIHTLLYRDGVPEMMIIHPDANKATGVSWVCEQLGVRREEVLALGDSANDIPMLQFARIGVAMGWAPEPVRRAADIVTGRNDPDGVATAIRCLILEKGT